MHRESVKKGQISYKKTSIKSQKGNERTGKRKPKEFSRWRKITHIISVKKRAKAKMNPILCAIRECVFALRLCNPFNFIFHLILFFQIKKKENSILERCSTQRIVFSSKPSMDIQFYASQFHLNTPKGIQDVSVCWRRSYLSCRLNIFMLNRNIQYPVITFDGSRLEHLIRTNNIGYKRNSDWFHSLHLPNCWYISLWTAGVRSLLFFCVCVVFVVVASRVISNIPFYWQSIFVLLLFTFGVWVQFALHS